jgi:hypothetical protein
MPLHNVELRSNADFTTLSKPSVLINYEVDVDGASIFRWKAQKRRNYDRACCCSWGFVILGTRPRKLAYVHVYY